MALSIVQVLSSFGMGGLERVALDLAKGQTREGHDVLTVSLAAGGGGPLAAEFRDAGLEIEMLPVKPVGFDVSIPFKLRKLFRKRHARVVHTHNPQPLIMSAVAARSTRAAIVHTKHGINPASRKQMLLLRSAARLVYKYVAVSDATADVARRRSECAQAKLQTVLNGIDLSRFGDNPAGRASVRSELGLGDDDFFALTVGRLWPEKGHDFLIRALRPILNAAATARRSLLAIAGDGPEHDNLVHLIADLELDDRVLLLGNRRDVPDLVAAADSFLLSSVREGLPLVIPEAMAAGLPVLATAVGGVPKVVVEGETGFLVESGDADALVDRLTTLRDDLSLRRELGERGRVRANESYSCERMVRDYDKIYQEAVRN